MKKLNLLNILILVTTVLFSTVEAFASTSVVQTLTTSAQPTVAIEKTATSVETGEINPKTGKHSGLNVSFNLQTNGTDDDYLFIVGSKIMSNGGQEVSAYSNDGAALLFGKYDQEEYLPTTTAIENAKAGGNNNPNVIVYPISSMTITSPMTVEFNASQENSEGSSGCYVVKVNSAQEGTLKQIIGGSPINNSYSVGQDMSGIYRAVVYFTAISK